MRCSVRRGAADRATGDGAPTRRRDVRQLTPGWRNGDADRRVDRVRRRSSSASRVPLPAPPARRRSARTGVPPVHGAARPRAAARRRDRRQHRRGGAARPRARAGDWELDPRAPAVRAGRARRLRRQRPRSRAPRAPPRPGLGNRRRSARAATEATFFYTNAAPQAAGFNQSKELWLGLEDHVLALRRDHRPAHLGLHRAGARADDPPYRGIRVPRRFWKVAAWSPATRASLAGRGLRPRPVRAHRHRSRGARSRRSARFRTFQVPIADIEELAGIDLGPLVDGRRAAARRRRAPRPGSRWTRRPRSCWTEPYSPARPPRRWPNERPSPR